VCGRSGKEVLTRIGLRFRRFFVAWVVWRKGGMSEDGGILLTYVIE